MKRIMLAVALLGGIMLVGPSVAQATQPEGLHCPDHNVDPPNVKVNVGDQDGDQDEINDLVIEAGVRLCVKAGSPQSNDGDGNTGIIVADGTSTLQEYLEAAGIVAGESEEGRDVSYYVIYPPLPEDVEAYVCFEGDIEVLTAADQTALNLLVSLFLELNVGAVQVESEDAECDEPVVTTTTTAPVVTTTTAPPVVVTVTPLPTVTVAPKLTCPQLGVTNFATTDRDYDADGDGIGCETPAPAATLPHTGVNSTLIMALVGLALLLLGGGFMLYSRMARS